MTEIFYDTEVVIEKAENCGSYSKDVEYTELFRIMADVQPYKTDGVQREYGISEGVSLVMYCGNCEIQNGMRAVIDNVRYIIEGTQKRSLGMKIYLKAEV